MNLFISTKCSIPISQDKKFRLIDNSLPLFIQMFIIKVYENYVLSKTTLNGVFCLLGMRKTNQTESYTYVEN